MSKITGMGFEVPERVLTNAYFSGYFKEDLNGFLEGIVGQRERHWLGDNESVIDLCIPAAQEAMQEAGITAADLSMVVVSSDTHEYISPPTSVVVQGKLGAANAMIFDLSASCASFVTALAVVDSWFKTHPEFRYALLIGEYGMTKYLDKDDKYTVSLFADGAAAFILENTGDSIIASKFIADGSYHDYLGVFGGGTKYPINDETLAKGLHRLRILKKYDQNPNLVAWPGLVKSLMQDAGQPLEAIDLILFTQINLAVIKQVLGILGIPESKSHWIMDRYGYTGSACIPMALYDARRQNKVKTGDLVVLVASGAGQAMGAIALRF
ncbi:MAG: 3-oxoacyl-ACP synthase III family protein [Candidatus Cryosericum sp.]